MSEEDYEEDYTSSSILLLANELFHSRWSSWALLWAFNRL